jgi:hypothetical protein
MVNASLNPDNQLQIVASPVSSPRDFDFYQGRWTIVNRKLKSRLTGCTDWEEFAATGEMQLILNGMGNTDTFKTTISGEPFEGMTLRLFNPATRLWSIYWADSRVVALDLPVVGSFDNNTGTFYTHDTFNGIPIIMKFVWDKTDPDHPVWSQAFSADNGQSWEWNWYMYMHRVKE